MNVTVTAVIAGVAVGVTLTLIMWKRLMQWSYSAVLPWIKRHLPGFVGFAEKAYEVLDRVTNYARAKIEEVVEAWRALRSRLLKQELTVVRQDDGSYVRQIVNWLHQPEQGARKVVRQVMEEQLDWDDLPPEVKRPLIRGDRAEFNLTQLRDEEVLVYEQRLAS